MIDQTSTAAPSCCDRWFWFLLAGPAAVFLFLALYQCSNVPLLDPDEPRYAGAGRTMAEGGSILVPEFNGEPRINKPPLYYWLVGLAVRATGNSSELTVRMPTVLSGLLLLIATAWAGRRLFDARTGLLAALMLATFPLFAALSRLCITDMTLSLWMSLALFALLFAFLEIVPIAAGTWVAALFLGLAVLTKATPAVAVILVVILDRALSLPREQRPRAARAIPWMLAAALVFSAVANELGTRAGKNSRIARAEEAKEGASAAQNGKDTPTKTKDRQNLKTWDHVTHTASIVLASGVVLLLTWMSWRAESGTLARLPWKMALLAAFSMGLWWYAALAIIEGWDRFAALVKFEIGGRIAGDVHREAMHYYLTHIPLVALPWTLALVGALGCAWPNAAAVPTPAARADRFLLAWLLAIVLFFSIPGGKLATYVLPAMPALALLIARFVVRLAGHGEPVPAKWRKITMAFVALMGLFSVGTIFFTSRLPSNIQDHIGLFPEPYAVFALVCASAVTLPWLLIPRGRIALASVILGSVVVVVTYRYFPIAIPRLAERSHKDLCLELKERVAKADSIVSLGVNTESMSYYLERPVIDFAYRRMPQKPDPGDSARAFDGVLMEHLNRPDRTVIFIERRYYNRMFGRRVQTLDAADIAPTLPTTARLLQTERNILVIQNF